MRVLIYSESDLAKTKRDELRARHHTASLRNPQFFNPASFDKVADLVIADDEAILSAYEDAGIKTERLPEIVAAPAVAATPKTGPAKAAKKVHPKK